MSHRQIRLRHQKTKYQRVLRRLFCPLIDQNWRRISARECSCEVTIDLTDEFLERGGYDILLDDFRDGLFGPPTFPSPESQVSYSTCTLYFEENQWTSVRTPQKALRVFCLSTTSP